jgi:septal ring factor EnvC (AmiA/AmiB activator)
MRARVSFASAAAGLALLVLGTGPLALRAATAGPGQAPPASTPTPASSSRAAERLEALQTEADALLARERTLLTDLRRLEVQRAIAAERLTQVETEAATIEQDLAATARHRELLEQARAAQIPALRTRLVELYKLGAGGYLRLLLGVENLRDVGRAYRTVTALAAADRERARAHESTMRSLAEAEQELTTRHAELARLREQAVAARAAAEASVRERASLIARIDERRDLNAQLTGELQTAQRQLQQTVTGLEGGTAALPLRPFQGTLDWPVRGRVIARLAPSDASDPSSHGRNGIEIAAPSGSRVTAVHDGTVAFAAPFTGFGRLVIVEHGGKSYSLYGYLDELSVTKGAAVERGQSIGTVGVSPAGPTALYFELRIDGRVVDPLQWLKGQPASAGSP